MKPDPLFLNQSQEFWANVRAISELCGYTTTKTGYKTTKPGYTLPPKYLIPKAKRKRTSTIRVPDKAEIVKEFKEKGLCPKHLVTPSGEFTAFGSSINNYFKMRAAALKHIAENSLMDATEASQLYEEQKAKHGKLEFPVPMNKQKGAMKAESFLTGLVNLTIASLVKEIPVDYDPDELTKITRDKQPLRTLSRRLDGAFPSPVDPIAIWEIKEYYYTTTFGSRVADGVYETMLDGFELKEVAKIGKRPHHILIVDSRYTWWLCGKSYLCRLVDMLHMGLVSEILFGREVVSELPRLVSSWIEEYRQRADSK